MRPIAIVGAPSSIGIRPYDDGGIRRLDLTPRVLRDLGLVKRLAAHDHGNVEPPPYHDIVRPAGRPRNEEGVAAYSRALADRIAEASVNNAFVLVLGGDCSIVLGSLLGLRHAQQSPVGLAYVDADVLDPNVMPAVDSPVPDGLELEELAELLTPLVRHPQALGLELTIYDPTLDPDRTSAARLVTLLEHVLAGKH
jgi:arginase